MPSTPTTTTTTSTSGSSGSDTLSASSGGSTISAGAGDDTLYGGSGSDKLNGDAGSDLFYYNVTQNSSGTNDVYTGGSGIDTVLIEFTLAQWLDGSTQQQISDYLAHLVAVTNSTTGEVSNALASDFTFHFGASTLTLQMMERLRVTVDGVELDPANALVTANADSATVGEDGAALNVNVLANDVVPDLVKDLAIATGPAHGTATIVKTDPANPATWSVQYQANDAYYQFLNAGQTAIETFSYRVTDANGDTQTATVSVTITGSNDAAVIAGTTSGSTTEKGGVANGTAGVATASGTLTAADVDNTPDTFTAVAAGAATTGGFGTYQMTSGGTWTYSLDDTNAAVQALNVGDTLTDTFSVTSIDGTSQLVTVTIHGANDAAVISGTSAGSTTEAGGVANGTLGTANAGGTLTDTDVDNPANAFAAVAAGTITIGGYGSFGMTSGGTWAYVLDDTNASVQALNVGDTLTDTFAVTTVDGTSQTVTITIDGANDAAVISGTVTGSTTEAGGVANCTPGTATASATLTDTDVDNAANTFTAVAAGAASSGGHGTYAMTSGGLWTYTLDDTDALVQALNVGDTLVDTFSVATIDGTTQTVTVTINGANDAAVISGTFAGSTTEASGVANGTPGTATASATLTDTDVDNAANTFTAVAAGTPSGSGYGTYAMTSGGTWTYTLDDTNTSVQALNVGDTLTDTFSVATVDGTTQTITVTINGVNDAAVISGTVTGSTTEASGVANGTPGTATASATLTDTDVDNAANTFTAVAAGTPSGSGYGTYAMTSGGTWTYTLDDTNTSVQALNVGDTLTDTFNIATIDGTTQTVTVTINGANDAAVISGTVTGSTTEASGVANGTPGTATASTTLTDTDVDNTANTFTAVAAGAASTGGYGTYSMTGGGTWTYTLDDTNSSVQALNVGDTLTDTFSVATIDGTTQTVTVTINGANDAAVIAGTVTGSTTEASGIANGTAGTMTASATLTDTDVDNTANTFTAVAAGTASIGGYGSYAMTVGGTWTYTLDDTNASVQALNVGDTLTDTFSVATIDGTTQTVTVTVNGANDAAVISGTITGSTTEASGVANGTPGTPTASATITDTDVDNTANTFAAVAAGTPSGSGYGTYAMTSGGTWTYALDDTNTSVQALNVGNTLTDTFSVATIDGTTQTVTVTINGANDAAVISGTITGSTTEASGVANGTPGTATASATLTDTDVDNAANTFTVVAAGTASIGGYGSYAMTVSGTWTYTLDDSNTSVQALNTGDTLTDTFSVATIDGTTQTVTITIDGANDAAVISGTVTGSTTEAGGVANGTPGTPTASATLTDTDVDNTANTFTVVAAGTASIGGYGSYAVTTGGLWTYTLDDTNSTVQALNVGDTLTDTFSVATIDGTTQTVTITIDGANDAAVIAGTVTGSTTEASGVANGTPGVPTASATLTDTDVDNTANTFTAVAAGAASTGGYGTYSMTGGGTWTYTLDDTNTSVQALNVGGTLTDTFSVATVDGTTQTVTVTINGANDAAVISGTVTGSTTEASGVANGTPGTATASATLTDTDVDNTANTFTAVAAGAASAGGYGSYAMTSGGTWTYTLDDTNGFVQALNVGDTLTDTFNIATMDGTTQTVTVTINGANDAAVISGTVAGSTTEASGVANGTPGTATASATLTDTDVDNTANTFTAVPAGAASTGGYGTYAMTTGGTWTYTLDDTNASVQALNTGGTLTDTFNFATTDGTTQTVTVTINGANDSAVISGTVTGGTTEAGGVSNGTPGTPTASATLTDTDVDNPANTFTAVAAGTASTGGYGTYAMTASGTWTYSLDNSNASVQALNVGNTLTDTFSVATVDGTTRTITVTIHGANDAAVISGTTTGSTTEAGSSTPGVATATGTLTDTDVDNAANTFTAVAAGTASTGGYGSYQMTAGGTWTYTLDNSNATVQALGTGTTLSDTFAVTTIDGTSQTVTITIHGSDDGPIAVPDNVLTVVTSGNQTVSIPEWALILNDTGGATDVDSVSAGSGLTVTHTNVGVGSTGTVDLSGITAAGGSFTYTPTDGTSSGSAATVNVTAVSGTTLTGTAGDEIIASGNSGSTIVGAGGNDILLGGGGNDTYQFGLNDGSDIISDAGSGQDAIVIATTAPTDSTPVAPLDFEQVNGTDLQITVGATQVLVKNHYGTGMIETIRFSNGGIYDGYAISTTAYNLGTAVGGTPQPDVIASTTAGQALTGGNGNDMLFGNGGADTIAGGNGNDLIVGGAGADSLSGDAANDVLVGGAGSDTLTGGAGNDVFSFDSLAAGDIDSITDFNAHTTGASTADKIRLSAAVFGGIGAGSAGGTTLAASDFAIVTGAGSGATAIVNGSVNVIFDSTDGKLYYDANGGDTVSGRTQIAVVTVVGTVDNSDFIVGL